MPVEVTSTRYIRPALSECILAYKGRRYWVIEIPQGCVFEGFSKQVADLLVWDGSYGTIIGGANRLNDKKYRCFASVGQGCTCGDATNYRDVASTVAECVDSYIKHCFT